MTAQGSLQAILLAIRNLDYDHFSDKTIATARRELMDWLKCDGYELNQLLLQFFHVGINIEFVDMPVNWQKLLGKVE